MATSRSAKVLILSFGQALTSVVTIVSAAVLTRIFSLTDYATYRQTILCYSFAVPFVTLGFNRGLYYFLPDERERPRAILVENLLLLSGAGLLLGLFLLVGGNHLLAMRFNNPQLAIPLLLLAPYPLLMLPAGSLPACLMARNRTEQVAGFTVISRLVMFAAIVLPCLIWPTPSTGIVGNVLGAAITTLAALVLMFRTCNEGDWRPTLAGIQRQVRFGVPLGIATLVGSVAVSLDQVLVSALCPPEEFAVFVNGAIEIPLIGVITGSVTSVLIVDYRRFHRAGQTSDLVSLIHTATKKCALLLFPAMAFLFCMAPELMCLLFGQAYADSAIPFRIYLLNMPVRIFTFGALLQATDNSDKMLIEIVIYFVSSAVLTWLAITQMGPLFAPAGAVAATYLFEVPYLVYVMRRILNCPARRLFPWLDLCKVMAIGWVGVPVLLASKYFDGRWPGLLVLSMSFGAFSLIVAAAYVVFGWVSLVSPRAFLQRYLTG